MWGIVFLQIVFKRRLFCFFFFSIDIKNTRRKRKKGKTTTLLMALTRSLLTRSRCPRRLEVRCSRRRCASVARRRASSGAPRAAPLPKKKNRWKERPEQKARLGNDDAAERPFESLDGGTVRRWERDSRVSSSDLFSVLFDPRERTRTRFPLFLSFRFRYKKILIQKVQTNRTI